MDTQISLMIFQGTCFLGFSLWLSVALINNLHAFASSVGAIGATMSMAPLRQPPVIDIPLLRRGLDSPFMHRLALLVIVALQAAAVLAAWAGCYQLLLGTGLEPARPWLNLALSATLGFLFAMLLGGLWFGYWIRQEGLQLTHLVLVIWVLLDFVVLNLRWA
ncbi:putative small integral membrane protein [Pseudomonas alcaligenes]|nr:putative small integral membrane protein [Pseudomonas alcaligenes]